MSTTIRTLSIGRMMVQVGYSRAGFATGTARCDIPTKYKNFTVHAYFTKHFLFGVGVMPQHLEMLGA